MKQKILDILTNPRVWIGIAVGMGVGNTVVDFYPPKTTPKPHEFVIRCDDHRHDTLEFQVQYTDQRVLEIQKQVRELKAMPKHKQ